MLISVLILVTVGCQASDEERVTGQAEASCTPHMSSTTSPEVAALLYEMEAGGHHLSPVGDAWNSLAIWNGREVSITTQAFSLVVEEPPTDGEEPVFAAGTLECTSYCEAGGHCKKSGCQPDTVKKDCTPCACSHKDDTDCKDDGCFCEAKIKVDLP
jgi:hypothetical protein